MSQIEISEGTKVIFTPTNIEFKIAKVTATRISWYVEPYKGGSGKNNMKMVWITKNQFQEALKSGHYKIV